MFWMDLEVIPWGDECEMVGDSGQVARAHLKSARAREVPLSVL